MSQGSLTPLQVRILRVLADMSPPWTLTGGGALAGFHLAHRETRDLDLFWRNRPRLEDLPDQAKEKLERAKLAFTVLRSTPAFQRLQVQEGGETCLIDLVSEPGSPLARPETVRVAGGEIHVDSRHEILVNKLCALLGRSELRDLVDLRLLLETGGDLERGLEDAPTRDGGFSAMTLAWVLRGLPLAALARSAHIDEAETERLLSFRDGLIQRLAAGPPG